MLSCSLRVQYQYDHAMCTRECRLRPLSIAFNARVGQRRRLYLWLELQSIYRLECPPTTYIPRGFNVGQLEDVGIPCVVNHNSSLGAHDSQIRSRDQASTHLGIAVCTRVLLLLELQVHPSLLTKKDGGTKACALAEYEKVARIDNKELRYSSDKEPEDKRAKRCLTDASVRSARTIPTTVGSTTDSGYVFG